MAEEVEEVCGPRGRHDPNRVAYITQTTLSVDEATQIIERLKERSLRTIVYPMHEPWLDVGREDDLKRAASASLMNHGKGAE